MTNSMHPGPVQIWASCISFADQADVLMERLDLAAAMRWFDSPHGRFRPGGGTVWSRAFAALRGVLARDPGQSKFTVQFLSDGKPADLRWPPPS